MSVDLKAYYEAHQHDFPNRRALLLPLLNLAQDTDGHVSDDAIRMIAEILQLTPTDVMAVASFYTLFDRKPRGRHLIQICTNLSCGVLAPFKAADYLCEKLGIPIGGTTADGKVTVRAVECLADCDHAPCMMLDDEQIGSVTREKIDEVLKHLSE